MLNVDKDGEDGTGADAVGFVVPHHQDISDIDERAAAALHHMIKSTSFPASVTETIFEGGTKFAGAFNGAMGMYGCARAGASVIG